MNTNEIIIALEHLLEDAIALGIKDSAYSGSALNAERVIAKVKGDQNLISFIVKQNSAGGACLTRTSMAGIS